ncbi:MAG: hypothetical protein COA90_05470 [Gammaproteobacteria bacterium]|nr:MAG: hypothetical protein COA90_05470 [Gammaproteobacteria bacterium]
MRAAGVLAFEYESARDSNNGICLALYNTSAFLHNKPNHTEQWLCETTANEVMFKPLYNSNIHHFPLDNFLVDGVLPVQA